MQGTPDGTGALHFERPSAHHFAELLALNEHCVPAVNSIDEEALAHFIKHSDTVFRVSDGDQLCGFVVCLLPGVPYSSVNYQWFEARYEQFAYVDRIMVAPAFRRQGVAAAIYAELGRRLPDCPRFCCEVNVVPPNPESMRLHLKLGFSEVARQDTEGGKKTVALLVREGNAAEVRASVESAKTRLG